jgi:hypothetical protein
MSDEKPPMRRFALKPKEVEPVDKVARPGDGTAISVQLIHQGNKDAAAKPLGASPERPALPPQGDEVSVFKEQDFVAIDPPSSPDDPEAITVSGMLRRNSTAARDSAPELIPMPPPRRSRRNRDFVVLVSGAAVSVLTLMAVFSHDRQIVALSLFIIVFVVVILAWIMYGVMDRY